MRVRGLLIGAFVVSWTGVVAGGAHGQPAEPAAPPPIAAPPPTSAPAEPAAPSAPPPAEPAPSASAPESKPAPEAPAPPPAEAPAPAPATAPAAPQPSAAPVDRFPESGHALFAPSNDARRHVGLSVRITVGAGFGFASHELHKGEAEIGGPNGLISVDVGGTPVEDLIVFGRLGGFAVDHARESDSDNVGTAFFGLIGAGARYHFMPYDWYASALVGLSLVSVVNNTGDAQNASPGFGFELETGKNWWAGSYRDRWTVGLGLRFAYARSGSTTTLDSDKSHEPWQGTSLSLVFSTSYN